MRLSHYPITSLKCMYKYLLRNSLTIIKYITRIQINSDDALNTDCAIKELNHGLSLEIQSLKQLFARSFILDTHIHMAFVQERRREWIKLTIQIVVFLHIFNGDLIVFIWRWKNIPNCLDHRDTSFHVVLFDPYETMLSCFPVMHMPLLFWR